MSERHILLFDAYASGHHGLYVHMLVQGWISNELRGRLDLVVPPDFEEVFPEVATYAYGHGDRGIRLSPFTRKKESGHGSTLDHIRRDLDHGRIMRRAILDRRPDHCLMMYMDHCQLSLWTNLRFDFSVTLSGIYFRPSFHYTEIGSPPRSPMERMQRRRKRAILSAALRNPHLQTVFSLDPFAVPHINRLATSNKAVALPDGITKWKRKEGVAFQDSRKRRRRCIALFFGGLNHRKGIIHVLESLPGLPRSMQDRLHLVLAGPILPSERKEIVRILQAARTSTAVQITLDDRYIPDEDLQAYIESVDVVLVAYQRHIGSSNVLIRAAAAAKPVLGSDFGLVGAQIRQHKLGLAIDTTSRDMIAKGLHRCIHEPDSLPFDSERALRFAHDNSADAFAKTIFDHLASTPPSRTSTGTLPNRRASTRTKEE